MTTVIIRFVLFSVISTCLFLTGVDLILNGSISQAFGLNLSYPKNSLYIGIVVFAFGALCEFVLMRWFMRKIRENVQHNRSR